MGVTWNPSDKSADITLSNGDLTAKSTVSGHDCARTTISKSSGKWYWEITIDYDAVAFGSVVGLGIDSSSLDGVLGAGISDYAYRSDGKKGNTNSWPVYGDSWTTNDILGIALDRDAGKVWFAKNGVWQASGNPASGTGEAFSGISGTMFGMFSLYYVDEQLTAGFMSSAFSYSVPSGFSALDPSMTRSISEVINVLSEFDDNFGELNENVNVLSEFACLVADSQIAENVSVNSELTYFETDSPISEEASVNATFVGEYTGDISEEASVNTEFISEHTGDLSENVSVNSEFVDYQRPGNLNVTLPMITADILGGQGGFLDATLPCITADIKGGAQLDVTLPCITASIEGKVGIVGSLNVTLPMVTANIEGKVETLGDIDATLPMIRAYITGKTGEVGSINVTLPMVEASLSGYQDISGDINVTLPLINPCLVGTVDRFDCTPLRYVEPI